MTTVTKELNTKGLSRELNHPAARLARPRFCEDAALVSLCREGDQDAWRELVERYSRYVYAIVTRAYGLDEDAAQDVFQEVFTRAYEHLDELRDPGALRPWIAQLARRLAIDRLRSSREVPGLEEVAMPEDPRDSIAELDTALSVQQMLAKLDEPFGEVLDRFFCRDESYRTIAAELGVPEGTIASRISRGLEQLRVMLEADGAAAALRAP